jgi:hypothetical protein
LNLTVAEQAVRPWGLRLSGTKVKLEQWRGEGLLANLRRAGLAQSAALRFSKLPAHLNRYFFLMPIYGRHREPGQLQSITTGEGS